MKTGNRSSATKVLSNQKFEDFTINVSSVAYIRYVTDHVVEDAVA